ncbi:hypothetical protein FGO68_gene46 [Halteria grandinella]|uniref:Macro domain-containing protein n=1 Tax=Halteria grandinella TaxID=5974 RepID=A0A8J8NDM4_HALGN|nr:hypothetical protein FGO68_gene46 [Halteria grandinella]
MQPPHVQSIAQLLPQQQVNPSFPVSHIEQQRPPSYGKERSTILEGWLKVSLIKGDITEEKVDAIVNPANSYLSHAGGIAGALSAKGGPAIQKESMEWVRNYGEVKVGNTATTCAGQLHCKRIIHVVGPQWNQLESKMCQKQLKQAVYNTLQSADNQCCRSISIPAISSGIFGYPKDKCAQDMFQGLMNFAYDKKLNKPESLDAVRIVIIDQPTFSEFATEYDMLAQQGVFLKADEGNIGGHQQPRNGAGQRAVPNALV